MLCDSVEEISADLSPREFIATRSVQLVLRLNNP